ncbi:MAG: peptide deformylase [Actinobacteria bacterium]|nr:peptide deformylase [Actinomycetota bacterium]
MIYRVLQLPDPVLRELCVPVEAITPALLRLVDDLYATMQVHNGLGLAAPQIGLPLRVAVIELPKEEDDPQAGLRYTLINPVIVRPGKPVPMWEACLSIPNFYGRVERAEQVTVEYTGLDGARVRLKAQGLLAHAVQHELDHLDGVLFIDRLDSVLELRQYVPDELRWRRPGEPVDDEDGDDEELGEQVGPQAATA